jgi:hypothetical protein
LNPESGDNPSARKKSRLPREYDRLDTDLDGYLSPTEMTKAVNDFNAGRSPYKQKDFYRLIDFYFRQEL